MLVPRPIDAVGVPTPLDFMFDYDAFGMALRSQIELAELTPSSGSRQPELAIQLGPPADARPLASDEATVSVEAGVVSMVFPGVGRFMLRPIEHRIEISAEPGAESLVSLPLLGPVIAVYLHLKDRLILHASAVCLDGEAIAFVGDKGAGKSTTAAAFLKGGGADLLTDDLLVLGDGAGLGTVERSYPQIKLNEDSALALPLSEGLILKSPHPRFSKTILKVSTAPADSPPLRAICVLARGEYFDMQQLSLAESLGALMRFAYVGRYGTTFLNASQGAGHFRRCARVASVVPVWSLTVPASFQRLEKLTSNIAQVLLGRPMGS